MATYPENFAPDKSNAEIERCKWYKFDKELVRHSHTCTHAATAMSVGILPEKATRIGKFWRRISVCGTGPKNLLTWTHGHSHTSMATACTHTHSHDCASTATAAHPRPCPRTLKRMPMHPRPHLMPMPRPHLRLAKPLMRSSASLMSSVMCVRQCLSTSASHHRAKRTCMHAHTQVDDLKNASVGKISWPPGKKEDDGYYVVSTDCVPGQILHPNLLGCITATYAVEISMLLYALWRLRKMSMFATACSHVAMFATACL